MPAAIKQKLQASRRSQVVNGTALARTFYMFLPNSIQRAQKKKKGKRKKRKKKEKQKRTRRLPGARRIFLLDDQFVNPRIHRKRVVRRWCVQPETHKGLKS